MRAAWSPMERWGPVVAAQRLASAAQEIAQQDADQLRVTGRGYVGRELERLTIKRNVIPHLSAAIAGLRK